MKQIKFLYLNVPFQDKMQMQVMKSIQYSFLCMHHFRNKNLDSEQ